jgi:hypothetical protein
MDIRVFYLSQILDTKQLLETNEIAELLKKLVVGGKLNMVIDSIEERKNRNNEIRLVTAALYETKVKEDEILRILMKVCDIGRKEAINALQNEKFMLSPCRELNHYLTLVKGYNAHEADIFIKKHARSALAGDTELSKLSSAKLFEAINKTNN